MYLALRKIILQLISTVASDIHSQILLVSFLSLDQNTFHQQLRGEKTYPDSFSEFLVHNLLFCCSYPEVRQIITVKGRGRGKLLSLWQPQKQKGSKEGARDNIYSPRVCPQGSTIQLGLNSYSFYHLSIMSSNY